MTAVLESSAPVTLASAEEEIRSSVVRRDHQYLYVFECAATWVADLARNRGERSAEAVLADITVICGALDAVDLDFFTCEGTG